MYRIWRITAIGETHGVLSACLLGHPTYLWVVVLIILVLYITKHLCFSRIDQGTRLATKLISVWLYIQALDCRLCHLPSLTTRTDSLNILCQARGYGKWQLFHRKLLWLPPSAKGIFQGSVAHLWCEPSLLVLCPLISVSLFYVYLLVEFLQAEEIYHARHYPYYSKFLIHLSFWLTWWGRYY